LNHARALYGAQNEYLSLLEEEMNVHINSRGNQIEIVGKDKDVQIVLEIFEQLETLLDMGIPVRMLDVLNATRMAKKGMLYQFLRMYEEVIGKDKEGHPIRVKNAGQWEYVQSVKKNDIVFGIGPAGTGKTYLAVVMAVAAMRRGDVSRIVMTRPAEEAAQRLS